MKLKIGGILGKSQEDVHVQTHMEVIDHASCVPTIAIGEVMQDGAAGEVVVSENENYKVGDHVQSMAGWRGGYTATSKSVLANKLRTDSDLSLSAFLGVAGMPRLTAYAGILRIMAILT